jgi:hypothetical protein
MPLLGNTRTRENLNFFHAGLADVLAKDLRSWCGDVDVESGFQRALAFNF